MQIKFQHFFYVQWVYYHKTAAMLDKFRLWFEKFDAELWDKQFEDDVDLVKISEFLYNRNGDTMTDKKIKKIPYGLANYERVVEKNCYYVDKTRFLQVIENTSDYLFFIRPRRFGKSLFLSVMEAYYDETVKRLYYSYIKEARRPWKRRT